MIYRLHLIALLVLLLACGGGGGGGASVASGGIGGTGLSQGPITAFGSRVVTGTSWDVSSAVIRSDGSSSFDESDLELGIIVTVEGERSADGLTGTANTVDFDNRIRGPIRNVVPGPGPDETSFTIFDVPVVASSGTILEPANLVLTNGMFVNVYGLVGSNGRIDATRIEDRGGSTEVEVKGVVLAPVGDEFGLDLDGDPFTIELTVVFDDGGDCRAITEFDPAGLRNDLDTMPFVEVTGYPTAPGEICADRVELEDEGFDDDDEEVEIEGIVTDFNSLADFRVAGVPVYASNASFFPTTLFGTLGDDDRVEVEGDLVSGVLRADKVHLIEEEVRLSAAADATSLIDQTVTALGLVFGVDGDTEFDGDSASLGEIDPGNFLRIEAVRTTNGLLATEITDRGFVVEEVELRGPVDFIDTASSPRRLTVLGITFEADDSINTAFEGFEDDRITADRFYERVREGDIIDAKDCVAPTNLLDVACEVEFED